MGWPSRYPGWRRFRICSTRRLEFSTSQHFGVVTVLTVGSPRGRDHRVAGSSLAHVPLRRKHPGHNPGPRWSRGLIPLFFQRAIPPALLACVLRARWCHHRFHKNYTLTTSYIYGEEGRELRNQPAAPEPAGTPANPRLEACTSRDPVWGGRSRRRTPNGFLPRAGVPLLHIPTDRELATSGRQNDDKGAHAMIPGVHRGARGRRRRKNTRQLPLACWEGPVTIRRLNALEASQLNS